MIDLNQIVKIKWMTRNVQYYKDLGYDYTGLSTDLFVKAKDLPLNVNFKVVVSCDRCGKEISTPYRNYNKIIKKSDEYRCRKCNAPFTSSIRIENNKEKALQTFEALTQHMGYKSIATKDDYFGFKEPMPFICKQHGIQYLSINQLQQQIMCPECGREIKGKHTLLTPKVVQERIKSKNGNVLLNPDEYINGKTRNLKIQCSCGNIFVTSYNSYANSSGYCPDCAIDVLKNCNKLTQEDIINRCTINGICYIVNPQDYINSGTKNLIFKCINCGETFKRDFAHYDSHQEKTCLKCSSNHSKGEEIISFYFDRNNITYETQKRFPNCKYIKTLPFDFYLPDYNMCVEFDGIQHYQKMSYDTSESFRLRQTRDKIKTEYCSSNDITLLRISYLDRDNIEQILNHSLHIV